MESTVSQIVVYGLLPVAGGVWLAYRRNRWLAIPVCLFFSWLGFVLALLALKKKCPHCAELMNASAKVCPHCGRNLKGGDVTISARK